MDSIQVPLRHRGATVVWIMALIGLLALVVPTRAEAYPWLIRRDYTGCATCHADPSGGGLLTPYGRALGEGIMRMKWGAADAKSSGDKSGADDDDGAKWGGFMWGAVPLPESLLLGGDVRGMYLRTMPSEGSASNRWLLMQADVQAEWRLFGRVRSHASIGYVSEGGAAASLTTKNADRMVSRTHWLGVDIGSEKDWLLRAGRMNLPFGIRSVEHTLFARTATRTDTNTGQQHGVALAYNGEKFRAEAMAILGNYQVSPDDFRERGYSASAEYAASDTLAIGASSLVVHAERDLVRGKPTYRHAHGASLRFAPVQSLVLLSEANLLLNSTPTANSWGAVGYVQADWEPIQGFHVGTTLETITRRIGTDAPSWGAWGSLWWFPLPHVDIRLDAIFRSESAGPTRVDGTAILAQVHTYL